MNVTVGSFDDCPKSSMFLVGDILYDNEFWNSHPFSQKLGEHIENAEYTVGNLECSLKSGRGILKGGPVLSTKKKTLNMLAEAGFNALSLANNHTMDYGSKGLEKTIKACERSGLNTFGAGTDIKKATKPAECKINNTKIGIFGLSQQQKNNAKENQAGTLWVREPGISELIKNQVRKYDISILVVHGDVAYVPIPSNYWRNLMHNFADLGLDAIITHHPHCPQSWEIYNGTPIFYSLGNFLMYRENKPSTKWAYGVNLEIGKNKIKDAKVIPLKAYDGKVIRSKKTQDLGYYKYLLEVSKIFRNERDYFAYWQEIAQRVFENRYKKHFERYGRGTFYGSIKNPIYLYQLTKKWIEKQKTQEGRVSLEEVIREEKDVTLAVYMRNGSRRDVIITAVETKTGQIEDYRKGSINIDLKKWYKFYGRDQFQSRKSRNLVEKLKKYLNIYIDRIF